jgi:hypothetical protein
MIVPQACRTAGSLGAHSESLGCGNRATNFHPCSSVDGDSYAGCRRHCSPSPSLEFR